MQKKMRLGERCFFLPPVFCICVYYTIAKNSNNNMRLLTKSIKGTYIHMHYQASI